MLILHHDPVVPASALATLRLQRLADDGLAIAFRGVDLLGVDVPLPVTLDVLAELRRVQPLAAAEGLRMRRPSARPPSAPLHVLEDMADAHGRGGAWRRAVVRGYWEDDLDLADPDVVADLAVAAGIPDDEVRRAQDDPRRLAAVRRRGAALRGDGVGGVPVLEVAGTLVPADLPDDELAQLAAL